MARVCYNNIRMRNFRYHPFSRHLQLNASYPLFYQRVAFRPFQLIFDLFFGHLDPFFEFHSLKNVIDDDQYDHCQGTSDSNLKDSHENIGEN